VSGPVAIALAVLLLLGNAFFVGRRVRAGLGPAHARSSRAPRPARGWPARRSEGDGEHLAGDRRQPARHHRLLAGPRCRRRARGGAPDRARARGRARAGRAPAPDLVRVALAIVVYLHVVLGEMIPKNIALAGPDRAALILGPADLGRRDVLRPVIVVINAIAAGSCGCSASSWRTRSPRPTPARRSPRSSRSRAARGCSRPTSTTGWPARWASPSAPCDGADAARDAHDRAPRLDRGRRRGALRGDRLQPLPGRGDDGELARLPAHQGRARDRRGPAPGRSRQVDPAVRERPRDDVLHDALETLQRRGAHMARVVDADGASSGWRRSRT
jgi:hypothetical protein